MEKLKNIGAGLILAGIAVGVIGVNVGRTSVWVNHYFPAIMFLCFLLPGGLIGATGMVGVAIQKRRSSKLKHS